VQQRLVRENLFVDLVGVTGKRLLTKTNLKSSKRQRLSLRGLVHR
jgi:hypothetical protein